MNNKKKAKPFSKRELEKRDQYLFDLGKKAGKKELIDAFIVLLGLDERFAEKDHSHYIGDFHNAE